MEPEHNEETVTYEIPSRKISGSVPELLDELDDMMEALQTVREAVLKRAPRPARPRNNRGWRARVGRALHKLHVIST